MDTITRQDRITLKNLKVADFASEETLCFTATVMFDGRPIAEARNDGHGGSTFVRALQGQAALLAQAEEFAKSLPPASLDVEREDDEPLLIDMTLDFLVDQLADAMHAERKLRTAFNRDIGNKVLFIKDGRRYHLPNKQLQSRMACKSGMNYQGRPIHFDLVDDWGYPIPQEDLYTPHFRANCETCGSKLICNGCSDCGKCL